VVTILANFFQVFGSLFYIFRYYLQIQFANTIIGIGCALIWITTMKYLQTSRSYSQIHRTFGKSMGLILRNAAGMLPIFIGFTFLGVTIFWRSGRFSNLDIGMFTLFAVMNGDMIFDTYNDLIGIRFLVAIIYTYSFIFIAIW